jgi:ribosomal protein L29
MRIKDVRHEIARILTIVSERASERRGEAPEAEAEAS